MCKPGETVVTAGQLQLAPGTKVVIKSSSNKPAQQPGANQRRAGALMAKLERQRLGRQGHDGEQPNGAGEEQPAARVPEPGEATPKKALVQFSSGLSRPFISRPVMTMLLTASIIVFGILTYNQLAVNDLPAVDYPVIQVERLLSGRESRNDGEHDRHAARETVHPNSRSEPDDEHKHAGQHQITLQFDLCQGHRRRRDRRAIGHPARHRPIAQRSAEPAHFTKTNPNDQPVMYIALTSDTLSDGELYRYGTTEVSQRINILPGVSQVNVYGVKGAIRIKVDPGALVTRGMTFDDLAAAIRAGTSYSGAGQFDGQKQLDHSPAERPARPTAEGYRNLIVEAGRAGRDKFTCATSPG